MNTEMIQCDLCPKQCRIPPGHSGDCRVRVNIDGELTALTYNHPCSLHIDPIEKKPLFHFLPGSKILSLATVGCNLHCKNCQNWEISQRNPEDSTAVFLPFDKLPALAKEHKCQSIAYTYTDPVIYYEYALDAGRAAKDRGIHNVLVTAAYINANPWKELCSCIDAANIDIKSMSDAFYQSVCDASLRPVLDAAVLAKSLGVMVEITNLIIPTLNDTDSDFTNLARWIRSSLGEETPLHFSAFTPRYRMKHLPPTPIETLERARHIALSEGLYFVYVGNVLSRNGATTFCPDCNAALIERRGYTILQNKIRQGHCSSCGKEIYGRWN